MDPVGDDLGGGKQRECALREPRMGQLESRSSTDHSSSQQEIDVERPGPPPHRGGTVASGSLLKGLALLEQLDRMMPDLEQHRLIEKVRLGGSGRPRPV